MLEAAHEAKRHQVDVVAGYIEPHARPDTQAMAEGLEEIPPLMVDYKGIQLREFNLDAALERKPKADSWWMSSPIPMSAEAGMKSAIRMYGSCFAQGSMYIPR